MVAAIKNPLSLSRHQGVLVLVVTALTAAIIACGNSPTCSGSVSSYAIGVSVRDSVTGLFVCDAAVVASNAGESYPLSESSDTDAAVSSEPCSYHVLAIPQGVSLTVSSPGYATQQVANALMHSDGACGYSDDQPTLVVKLVPTM